MREVAEEDDLAYRMARDEPIQPREIVVGRARGHRHTATTKNGSLAEVHVGHIEALGRRAIDGTVRRQDHSLRFFGPRLGLVTMTCGVATRVVIGWKSRCMLTFHFGYSAGAIA